MIDRFEKLILWLSNTQSIAIVLTSIAISVQIFYFYRKSLKDLSIGYRISVIGIPRAGKTALIGAIFDRIFSAQPGDRFAPVGQETIHRINRVIASLDSRSALAPTKETDVFIFRFIYYKIGSLLFKRIRYEGEVVDFPGELSQRLLESASDGTLSDDIGIFHKEFYSWIVSSRVHIFVIDLAQYLLSENRDKFTAQMIAEIRAAWQLLNEEISQSARPRDRRVALVFTKCDLLETFDAISISAKEREEVRIFGYERAPELQIRTSKKNSDASLDSHSFIEFRFEDLIYYFKRQNCTFDHFFVSAYKNYGARPGISELVDFILPNGIGASRRRSQLSASLVSSRLRGE